MTLSNNAQLADIIASVTEGIVIIDGRLRIVLFNPAAEQMFGRSREEMIGQPLSALLPERFRAQHDERIRNFAAAGQTNRALGHYGRIYGLRANGEEFPIEATISQTGTSHNKLFTVILRDITWRIEAEKALRSYATRLHELSRRLREVEESERHAIARELHDRIGQGLSTLSLMVGTLGVQLPEEARSAVQTQLKDIQALLKSVVAHVRDVMAELRPPVLDDYGLLAALRHLVTEFAKRTGIAVNVSGVDPYPRLPLVVETAMFRISQEALTNIVKHAHAKKVEISLNAVSDRVVLDIADDGSGFDASNAPDGGEHWGMITMRERAEAVGITFRLKSAPGAGTRIVLEAERAAS